MKPQDTVAEQLNVYKTTNYAQFKLVRGNRFINKRHVNYLKQKIDAEGNRLPENPIEVNEDLEVIDGQHRLRVAEVIGSPIYYIIRPHLTIADVISKNTGQLGWSWLDYVYSWAERGNEQYKHFLQLQKEFGEKYGVLYCYATGGSSKSSTRVFREGELRVPNYEHSRKMLGQYHDIKSQVGDLTRNFATAIYRFMNTPGYNHEVFLSKLAAVSTDQLYRCISPSDYLFVLEEIWRS